LLSNTDEKVPRELAAHMIAEVIERQNDVKLRHVRAHEFGPMAGRGLGREELPGTYASEIGPIVIERAKTSLTMTMMGNRLYLVPKEGGSYGLQARIAGILPLPIPGLTDIRLMFREINGDRAVAYYEKGIFRSIALSVEPSPVPEAWSHRYGSRMVMDPDPTHFVSGVSLGYDPLLESMTLTVKVASIPGPLVFLIHATGEDRAGTSGLGRHMGEPIRVIRKDGGELLRWAGLTLAHE